jgi:hypothetical protein
MGNIYTQMNSKIENSAKLAADFSTGNFACTYARLI